MKPDPLSATVALALAAMSGAVCSHRAGLDAHLALARHAAVRTHAGTPPAPTAATTHLPATHDAPAAISPAIPAPTAATLATTTLATTTTPTPAPAATDVDQRILNLVERMQGEQLNLRDQLAEANRDLMELRFRVDTHSESFRPLRATPEVDANLLPPDPAATGVLPPLDNP